MCPKILYGYSTDPKQTVCPGLFHVTLYLCDSFVGDNTVTDCSFFYVGFQFMIVVC